MVVTIVMLACQSDSALRRLEIETCMRERVPGALNAANGFKKYLLEEQLISEWTKPAILEFMGDLNAGKVTVKRKVVCPSLEMELSFYSQGHYAEFTECFGNSSNRLTPHDSMLMKAVGKMVHDNNNGPPLDEAVILSIDEVDFDSDMARIAVLYVLWPKLQD